MFVKNIKTVFTHEFIGDIFTKIDDAAADVNEIILCIVNTLKNADIPKLRKGSTKAQPVWFDKECERPKSNKIQRLGRFRRNRSQENLQNYIQARNSFKNLTEEKKKAYMENKLDSLLASIDDSKSFWSKLKSLTSKKNQAK